ncbi:MAG: Glu/Leu/Phe/Val dehydrogenase [Acidimicrobiia bacterium]|nr:Glu/Leu/Phe/Val dehydrogenase [Acidimicrobiia bacterium]
MEAQWLQLSDDLGPEKVILITEPSTELRGILVVDNTAAGPAIGGIRMALDVTVDEVFRLARAMTFKNAAAGLRHGGGKAGIIGDPDMPDAEKERLVRAFGIAIKDIVDYIPGPDMGIDEACMAYLYDEIGRVVGLPKVMGGIPLDTLGATGFGLAIAAEVAEELEYVRLDGAKVVIQGFGAVGTHGARFLAERGAVIVAVSDSRGGVVNDDGLDLDKLLVWKAEGHPVREFADGTAVFHDELIGHPCDIWVPAARPDVFTADNAAEVNAKVILPGANIAVTPAADQIFFERDILSIPDFIANAGGVICGAVEYHGGTATQAFQVIEEKIRANTREVLENALDKVTMPATAAAELARSRVEESMSYHRSF